MWEYQWLECATDETSKLSELGRAGWEAVGVTPAGTSLGRTYVTVLLKRLAPATIDLVSTPVDEPREAPARQ